MDLTTAPDLNWPEKQLSTANVFNAPSQYN